MRNPDASADHVQNGRRRWRRVGQNAGALAAARVVSGLCQLALVPLLLGMLGTELFGWTMALVALTGLSQFADLGVAMALQQKLSEAWAREDQAGLRQMYSSGLRLLGRLGLGWLVILAPLAWWLGGKLLVVPGAASGMQSGFSWLLIAAAVAVGLPLSAGPRLAAALQLGWIHAGWTAAANVATLLAIWACAQANHTGTVGIIALLCAGQLVPGLVTAIHLARRLGWHGRGAPSPSSTRELWQAGRKFAAPNLAGALLTAAAPAAVARFGGYEATAAFSVLQRLFGTAQQAHAMALAPLWPAWAEALGRGEIAWVRHSLRFALALTFAAAAALALATAGLPIIIHLWLGASGVVPNPSVAWLVAIWISASMFSQAFSYFLLGTGRLDRVALPVAIAHLVTLGLVAALGNRFGGIGVVAGLAIGASLGPLVVFVRETVNAWCELPRKNSTPPAPVVIL